MIFKDYYNIKRTFFSALLLFSIGIVFVFSFNNAYATYPPTFSDCTHGDGEEYDQVDACQQLLRSNSKRRELHVALGKTLDKRQKHKQAVKAYQNALLIFPEDKYFINKLSIANSNLKEKQWLNNKNTSSSPATVQFKLNKLRCTRLTGDIALKACNEAIKLNNKDAVLYISQGDIYASQQKNKQAMSSYQQALKLNPEDKLTAEKLKQLSQYETIVAQKPAKQPAVKSTTPEKTAKKKITQPEAKKIKSNEITNVQTNKQKSKDTKLKPKQQKFFEQLNFLTSLKVQGIISEAEYQQRKNALLDANFRIPTTSLALSKTLSSDNKKTTTAAQKEQQWLKELNFGNYHALIIGNNEYKYLQSLETAVNDAQTLADLLTKEYGFKVKLLLNANRYNTLKAMGEYRQTLNKQDNLLIYYAGHGVLDEVSERGYWLPTDAEENFTSNWISTADITDTLKALQSWHVLVVADSCYSGTLARSATVTIKNPEQKHSLYKRLLKKKSRTVITSGGLEPVTDSGGDELHSVFAKAFLDVLRDNNNAIEAEQIFSRLRDKVILNADQTPEYSNVRKVGHNGGDFIFLRQ